MAYRDAVKYIEDMKPRYVKAVSDECLRTTSMSTPAVRTDREPIAKRFPQLGDFIEVHWQGSAAGADPGGVPGPTDVHIQALAVLRPNVLASAASRYDWKPAPAGWDAPLSPELRRFAPAAGAWHVSEQFAQDVRTTRYSGAVYLDTTGGTVYLDVIGG
jgi:hypothetical protein